VEYAVDTIWLGYAIGLRHAVFGTATHAECTVRIIAVLGSMVKAEGQLSQRKRAIRPRRMDMERVAGIEPARSAWEADRLPLHHTRLTARLYGHAACRRKQAHLTPPPLPSPSSAAGRPRARRAARPPAASRAAEGGLSLVAIELVWSVRSLVL
jgi:hypothetical protein